MAGAFVAANGKGGVNAGTALTFTTTRTILAGEHVCVAEHSAGGGALPTSITVGSLSLTNDALSNVQTNVSLWSARASAQIASGSTVAISYSSNPTNQQGICFSLSGIATSSYLDQTKVNNYVSIVSPSTGATATTAQANEIAVGVIGQNDGTNTLASDLSYTEIDELNDAVGNVTLECSYLVLTATATATAQWTSSPSASYGDCLIATYKAAAGSTRTNIIGGLGII